MATANAAYFWGRTDFHGTAAAPQRDSHIALDFPVRIPDLPMPSGRIESIATGDLHCAYASGGRLFGFGSNTMRQLHHLALDVCETVTEIKLPDSATGKPVEVACGANFTLVRLDDGSVMSAGNNEHSQLGHISDTTTPQGEKWRGWNRVALSVPAQRIYAAGHSCFVLSEGVLYSWGQQKHGHLGHGTTGEREREKGGVATVYDPVPFPARVQWFVSQKHKIAQVAIGHAHLLVRTTCGDLFGVGDNSYGKLAVQGTSLLLVPHRIKIIPQSDVPETLVDIHASADCSFACFDVSNIGRVCYTWGKINADCSSTPLRILHGMPTDLACVAGGQDFQTAISADGELHAWGLSRPLMQTGTSMLSFDPSIPVISAKSYPRMVESMRGKHVVGATFGKCFGVILADDTKFEDPETLPENTTRHVMVPKSARYVKGFTPRLTPTRFEEAMQGFWTRLVGPARAAELMAEVPTATEVPVAVKQKLAKRGASALHIGSKVRVWMSDVYALGNVIGRDLEGYPKNSFEIKWVREDWDPEVVELVSNAETLDEANDDRWQSLWFVDPPAAAC